MMLSILKCQLFMYMQHFMNFIYSLICKVFLFVYFFFMRVPLYSEIKVVIIAAIAKCVWADFLVGVSNEKAG